MVALECLVHKAHNPLYQLFAEEIDYKSDHNLEDNPSCLLYHFGQEVAIIHMGQMSYFLDCFDKLCLLNAVGNDYIRQLVGVALQKM